MPRRLPALACAAAVVLALSACIAPTTQATPSTTAAPSVSATPSATPSTTASAAPAPSASVSGTAAEQTYLGFVSQFSPTLAAMPQSTLLALGKQVCSGFQQGQDATRVSTGLGSSTLAPDLEATDAAVIIGAAVAQLCPQYRSALDG